MKQLFIQMSVCMISFISACSSVNNSNSPEKFPVTHPIVLDTVHTSEYVADIHSRQNVEIRARVKGHIEKIYVDEGSFVKQGQLLFALSNKGFQQDLLKARAALSSAIAESKTEELALKNIKILVEKNVVSLSEQEIAQSRLDAANAKVEETRAEEANALLNLSYTEIRAPFDGVINRIPNKTGSLVDDGTLLTTISDNKEVFTYFRISEREYLDFTMDNKSEKDKKVELILANNRLYNQSGVIETVEGEIDKATGNIAFRARFANKDGILKHGASGKIRIKRELKDALIIPQKSTFEIQEKTFVYVMDQDNTIRLVAIEPKLRLSTFYVIDSGLSTKDVILYEGIQRVKEGDKIIPVYSTTK